MSLQSNAVSHWLGANPESALIMHGKTRELLDLCELTLTRCQMNTLQNQEPISHKTPKRLIARSHKVLTPRDWVLKSVYCLEIWRVPRQQCCRSACQNSDRHNNFSHKSRGFARSYEKTTCRNGPSSCLFHWRVHIITNILLYDSACCRHSPQQILKLITCRAMSSDNNGLDYNVLFIMAPVQKSHMLLLLHIIYTCTMVLRNGGSIKQR